MSKKAVDHVCSVFLRQVVLRMKDLGLNRTVLAKRMKVSKPYITALLNRDVNISFATAVKLAKAVQMDFSPVLTEEDEIVRVEKRARAAGLELSSMANAPKVSA